jgi:hypothetical protein
MSLNPNALAASFNQNNDEDEDENSHSSDEGDDNSDEEEDNNEENENSQSEDNEYFVTFFDIMDDDSVNPDGEELEDEIIETCQYSIEEIIQFDDKNSFLIEQMQLNVKESVDQLYNLFCIDWFDHDDDDDENNNENISKILRLIHGLPICPKIPCEYKEKIVSISIKQMRNYFLSIFQFDILPCENYSFTKIADNEDLSCYLALRSLLSFKEIVLLPERLLYCMVIVANVQIY